MLVASFGGSYGNSDYVESAKNSPTGLFNKLDLAGYISKLEAMHELLEGELNTNARPTVIFSHTDELEIPELADAKINPPKKHQDNGATLIVNTHTSPPYSPLEDTYVATAETLPRPCVKARDAALQAHKGGHSENRFLGSDNNKETRWDVMVRGLSNFQVDAII